MEKVNLNPAAAEKLGIIVMNCLDDQGKSGPKETKDKWLEAEGERMERIKELNRYQQGILILLVVMIIVFGVI